MTLKRIGIIGDVHAEDTTLVNATKFLINTGVDGIYCTGDLCDGYGNTESVIQYMQKSKIYAVRGNHDLWCVTNEMRDLPGAVKSTTLSQNSLQYLSQLPYNFTIDSILGPVLLCHGLIDNIVGKVSESDTEEDLQTNTSFQDFVKGEYPTIMINGHSHRRMVKKILGKILINAGTLFRDHSPCVCYIDFKDRLVRYYSIDESKIITDTEEKFYF